LWKTKISQKALNHSMSNGFFTIKDNGRYKARLVVKGFRQIKGADYTCTYSPTIEVDSFRLIIAIASIYI